MAIRLSVAVIILLKMSLPAAAYVGPGMAGGVIASVLGFLGAFFLLFFGIIYYPLKRALKKRQKNQNSPDQDQEGSSKEESDG